LLLPGVGTIHELKKAYELGVRSVRVATQCTEADVSAQHIAAARELIVCAGEYWLIDSSVQVSDEPPVRTCRSALACVRRSGPVS